MISSVRNWHTCRAHLLLLVWALIGFHSIGRAAHSSVASAITPPVLQEAEDIIVAVIDTGLDINHAFLKESIWTNPGETGFDSLGRDKSSNGIDDDKNGFTDDAHGWDFVTGSPDLQDHDGHGTHIAGIIKAQTDSYAERLKQQSRLRLMALKYFDSSKPEGGTLRGLISAIRYAIHMKAKIINISGGGATFVADEFAALREADLNGILVVASSGNKEAAAASTPFFPAGYGLKNILSVTAIDEAGALLATSNTGPLIADLAAPGFRVRSSLPQQRFGRLTGTSQAAAFASGIAAFIASTGKRKTAEELKTAVIHLGSASTSLATQTRLSILLNPLAALEKFASEQQLKVVPNGPSAARVISSLPDSNVTNATF